MNVTPSRGHLQPLIQARRPRRAEPLADPVGRDVGALDHQRQQAGKRHVRLGQQHLPGCHVHRIAAKYPLQKRGRVRVVTALLQQQQVEGQIPARAERVAPPARAQHRVDQHRRVQAHVDELGLQRVQAGQVLAGMQHVVRVHRVGRTEEVQEPGRPAEKPASEMGRPEIADVPAVGQVVAELRQERRRRGRKVGRPGERRLGLVRGGVAPGPGGRQHALRLGAVTGAWINERAGLDRPGARVLARL